MVVFIVGTDLQYFIFKWNYEFLQKYKIKFSVGVRKQFRNQLQLLSWMFLDASLTLLDQKVILIVPTRNSRYVFSGT